MTTEVLLATYSKYTNEQLLEVYNTLPDYSPEAKAALLEVIKNKGGLEALQHEEADKKATQLEIDRIKEATWQQKNIHFDAAFLAGTISSGKLDKTQVKQLIEETQLEIQQDSEDRKVKPRTIISGIPAAVLAAVLAGVMWGLQLMWSGRMFLIIFTGVILLCYGIVKGLTRQSYKNPAVLILTIISVACSLFIGQLMFEVFGRQ